MSSVKTASRAPALITRRGLLALTCAAAVCGAALFPLAEMRASSAGRAQPSSLALAFLRLRVAEQPADAQARLELARTAGQLGLLAEARAVLAPLREQPGPSGHAARAQLVELARAAWAATPAGSVQTRERALNAYRASLHAVRPSELDITELENLSALARESADEALRAELMGALLRRPGAATLVHVERAEAAFLATEQPLEAARVLTEYAVQNGDLKCALRALAHARSAAQASDTWQLYLRMTRSLGPTVPLLELGLTIASEHGDRRNALVLAEQLLVREPAVPARHARVLQIAAWSSHTQRALREQLWLLDHGAGPEVLRGAEQNANALSDLRVLRRLYERPAGLPATRRPLHEVLQQVVVYEALGEPGAAYRLIRAVLDDPQGPHRRELVLWNLRYALERAEGKLTFAVATLREMDAHFPSSLSRSELQADLLLRLGRSDEALELLAQTTPPADYKRLTRLGQLTWSAAKPELASAAYQAASELPEAKADDFFRLYKLQTLDGALDHALQTSLRGLGRFDTVALLELSISAALAAEDADSLSTLFERSERTGHPLRSDPSYVRLRVSYRQRLAAASLARGALDDAGVLLATADDDLARGLLNAQGPARGLLTELVLPQRSQELSLALARDDKAELARLYPAVAQALSARQRVHLLHRMERDEQALDTALTALRDQADLSEEDRAFLERDAEALASRRPRNAGAQLELTDMGTLRLWQGRAQASYASAERVWSVGVQYIELSAQDTSLSARPHEVIPWAGLRKIWSERELGAAVGVDLRNGRSPRPYVVVSGEFRFTGKVLSLAAQVDEVASDTAALRALGLRDHAGVGLEVPFAERLYGSLNAGGSLYSTRDRTLVGAGITLEGAVGARLFPADSGFHGSVRLATRVAPRWTLGELPASLRDGATPHESARGWLVPDSTTWLGVGATLGRGTLATAPIFGRDVRFVADGSVGMLVPQRSVGFFARAGAATSLFGGDLFGVSGRASNVVGTAPTRTAYSVQLDYTLGLWR